MQIVSIPVLRTSDALVQYLKGLTASDHFKIAKSVGIQPKDKADAHLYADYIVQGIQKGLVGPSLVQYAEANVKRLQGIMPHLKAKAPAPDKVKAIIYPAKKASVAKPAKVVKVKSKKPSVAKPATPKRIKYEDFTIVFREDRNGYEGWYGGKAEAFRETVEKVQSFFQKKYQRTGAFKIVK
jgi:hypothetical protein